MSTLDQDSTQASRSYDQPPPEPAAAMSWVTYPGHNLASVIHTIQIQDIQDLYNLMQMEHELISKTRKYLKDCMGRRIECNMSYPVLEAQKVIRYLQEQSNIPNEKSKIFLSTATANSGNNPAPLDAMLHMNIHINIDNVFCTSTATKSGLTGVSYVKPRHKAVFFDQNAQIDTWPQVSHGLFNDFMKLSNQNSDQKYDYMFHWGCISQNWRPSLHNTRVSSWANHEHWNLLMTIAMMRHAMKTLNVGGTLCLKVRIFKSAETQGLVALMSKAFGGYEILTNPRQLCTFVTFVGSDFHGQDDENVQSIQQILARCTSYKPVDIFCHEFCLDDDYMKAMQKCAAVADEMQYVKHQRTTVWLGILRELEICMTKKNALDERRIIEFLTLMNFSRELNDKCMVLICRIKRILDSDDIARSRFLTVMNDQWIREAC
jgi:hypothetical protein